MEYLALVLFALLFIAILLGYPVAPTLAGVSLIFGVLGASIGAFDMSFFDAWINRIYGLMQNELLIALPLFIFMGCMLDQSNLAKDLINGMAVAFSRIPGGLAISVVIIGMLLAASTGVVGASVTTLGILCLPTMLQYGYNKKLATGVVAAAGTLGQLIPPSLVLIILGDVVSNSYQLAQSQMGNFSSITVSIGDLFFGALIPGLILVGLYCLLIFTIALWKKDLMPSITTELKQELIGDKNIVWYLVISIIPCLFLIISVLGSILLGLATPTESAAIGCVGVLLLSIIYGRFKLIILKNSSFTTASITARIMFIFIGAYLFSLVFRGFGGDEMIIGWFKDSGLSATMLLIMVLLTMFVLGFFLDFIEISIVLIPIIAPALFHFGFDPVWLGVVFAIVLQSSFLTPPFGFSLFYLRSVAPADVKTTDIYTGIIPFVAMQAVLLIIVIIWPSLITWFPAYALN